MVLLSSLLNCHGSLCDNFCIVYLCFARAFPVDWSDYITPKWPCVWPALTAVLDCDRIVFASTWWELFGHKNESFHGPFGGSRPLCFLPLAHCRMLPRDFIPMIVRVLMITLANDHHRVYPTMHLPLPLSWFRSMLSLQKSAHKRNIVYVIDASAILMIYGGCYLHACRGFSTYRLQR